MSLWSRMRPDAGDLVHENDVAEAFAAVWPVPA